MHLVHSDLAFCLRRAPKKLLELLKKHPNTAFVAGGYIRACIANEEVNDVDIFAPSAELAKAFAEEYADGKEPFETDNAYTVKGNPAVQFVHRWVYNNPEDLLKSFDFSIATAAFWFNRGWRSMCGNTFYPDLAAKRLAYLNPVRNEDAGGSMLRVLKFYQKGYRIPLDSLGAVVARLMSAVDRDRAPTEASVAKVVTGLLREVDPNIDPNHIAHLPSAEEENAQILATD